MSEKKSKQERRMKVVEEEVKGGLCGDCHSFICDCVIERIKTMENAMHVAQQAIGSLEVLNNKLHADNEELLKREEDYKQRLGLKQISIEEKRKKELDKKHQRFINRQNLLN